MIAFVKGIVTAVEDDSVILDIGGVGLCLCAPLHRLDPHPVIGSELLLHTHLAIREDAWLLYGFSDKDQLRMFRLLLNVSGVGAKTALSIVDAVTPSALCNLVVNQDIKPLTAVSGVGKKTAERIMLELKDKLSGFTAVGEADSGGGMLAPAAAAEADRDLLSALRQLGYSAIEARSFALRAQEKCGDDATEEQLLREALRVAMHS